MRKNYAEYIDGEKTDKDVQNTGIFQSLDCDWHFGYDVEDIAKDLILNGWEYSQVKELEDFGLYFESERFKKEKREQYVLENNLVCPFKVGDKVRFGKTENEKGEIVDSEKYASEGKVLILTEEHKIRNQTFIEEKSSSRVLGEVVGWEKIKPLK